MGSKKTGNVCVSTGEYKDNSGQLKKSWHKVGVVLQDENGGKSIKLEVLPMPKMQPDGYPAVWLRIFDNDKQNNNWQPRQQPSQQQRQPRDDNYQHNPDDPDDIAF